jgi:hypothetical protein
MYSTSFSESFTDIPTKASTPFPIELISVPSTEKGITDMSVTYMLKNINGCDYKSIALHFKAMKFKIDQDFFMNFNSEK